MHTGVSDTSIVLPQLKLNIIKYCLFMSLLIKVNNNNQS